MILKSKPRLPRCAGVSYDPVTQKCCYWRVIPKRAPCTKCFIFGYDPSTHLCCERRIILKNAPCYVRCAQYFYNIKTHQCCGHSRVIPKSTPCRSTCGPLSHNPNTQRPRVRIPLKPRNPFFRAFTQLLKLRFTAMVTYSFHLYSRSSHNFILCSFLSRVDELNKLAGLQCMSLHSSGW